MLGKYEAEKLEHEVLDLWKKKKIYEKQKAKGKKGPKFYWICGPPYTSGKFHIGHFWNYAALKDPLFRYKRMKGFDVWDRGGWDMHGLPTARKVMAKLGLKSRDDVQKLGIGKFVTECEKFSVETMEQMTKDYVRWGVWYDHKNAYQPISQEYMESIWWGIKKANENGFLYEGDRVMAWCPESETVAAKHELEYVERTDESIFLKFKLKNSNEFLVVWTTTPWTIPHNLGVMVNPDFEYAKCKVDGEVWIVAKELAEKLFDMLDKKYEVVGVVKGKELEGMEYVPFLAEEVPELLKIKSKHKNAFTVMLSKEYVTLDVGSGLVHVAPGCGPEDQEVGSKYGLPAFNEVDERGIFSDKMGEFKGWKARSDDKKFSDYFERKGNLVHRIKYTHDYPIHERSKCEVIFRTTKQWFFAVEKVKDKLKKWNKTVKWVPEWAGSRTFESWIDNLKDIGITRQREWGTPVPVWKCGSCGNFIVVGSLAELKKLSGKKPKNMHKPWIDEIKIKCKKCKGIMNRIPDICDVWLDAGSASWGSLHYPHTDKYMKKYYPGDFILEAKDQIRGWFNLLFDAATVAGLEMPFKACYMTGWTIDAAGRKMSKSLGNQVDPYEMVDKYGADTVRYYMMGSAQPGVDMVYNFKDAEVKFRNLGILWNMTNWLIDFAKVNKIKSFDKKPKLDIEERHIFSKLNKALRKVTEMFDNYQLNEIPNAIEEFYLELSRGYLKATRDKANSGSEKEKYLVGYAVYQSLLTTLKMFGTVCPFISERLYQELKQQFKIKEESIQLFDWPAADDSKIDEKLEDYYTILNNITTAVFSIRDRQKVGIRWPLSKAIVYAEDKTVHSAIEDLSDIFKSQCNIKEIEFIDKKPNWLKSQIRINQSTMNKKFKKDVPKIVGTLLQKSPNSIQAKLDKDKKFELEVDGEKYEIVEEDIFIEETMPADKAGVAFEGGTVYLDLKLTENLLVEGFMREIMRRIQDLRKEAKMSKGQKAKAVVMSEKELVESLKKYKEEMEEKTGCKIKLQAGEKTAEKFNKVAEIKGRKIAVGVTPA